jgi:hypothetical protein
MSNNDFKKVRSVITRKEIWQEACAVSDHLCAIKLGEDSAYPGIVFQATQEGVWVRLDQTKLERSLWESCQKALPFEILGFLTVKENRYYFVGKTEKKEDFKRTTLGMEIFLSYQFELFKLDRRSNFRVNLDKKDFFKAAILFYDGQAVEIKTLVKDVSGGGFRLIVSDSSQHNKSFQEGSKIRGELYPTKEKSISFEGVVRHSKYFDGFLEVGIMVVEDQIKSSFRLMALTLVLQRQLLNQQYKTQTHLK